MKPGWSSNRSTTPTWERVGNRRKSSPWVFVSAVRCLGRVSWCLRKQRGLYPATAGTGFNAFTMQDHIWIMKVLKAVLCRSGLFAAWAALWESLLVNTFLELIMYCTVLHNVYICCFDSEVVFINRYHVVIYYILHIYQIIKYKTDKRKIHELCNMWFQENESRM